MGQGLRECERVTYVRERLTRCKLGGRGERAADEKAAD